MRDTSTRAVAGVADHQEGEHPSGDNRFDLVDKHLKRGHYAQDQLIETLATEVDLAKRDELIQKVWDTARADVVYLPLHHQVIAWGLRDTLDMPIVPNDSPQFRWANFK